MDYPANILHCSRSMKGPKTNQLKNEETGNPDLTNGIELINSQSNKHTFLKIQK